MCEYTVKNLIRFINHPNHLPTPFSSRPVCQEVALLQDLLLATRWHESSAAISVVKHAGTVPCYMDHLNVELVLILQVGWADHLVLWLGRGRGSVYKCIKTMCVCVLFTSVFEEKLESNHSLTIWCYRRVIIINV